MKLTALHERPLDNMASRIIAPIEALWPRLVV